MKRVLCLCIAVLMSVLSGCTKEPTVAADVLPQLYFSHYGEFTDLYGTPCMDTLDALGVDLHEVNIIHEDRLGIPKTESYAGVEFAVYLQFGGDDSHLCGVDNQATYQYPEDEEKLLRDIVTISKSLIKDFGEASDVSFVFNWVQIKLKEAWNRDIAYWQDIQVLKRLFDEGFDGELLYWNMTPLDTVKEELKSYGDEGGHSLSFSVSIDKYNGTATLSIVY